MNPAEAVRKRVGDEIFARVAGDEGPARRDRIHGSVGPRRYPPGSAIHVVHSDASMFVGGIRALLLQSLHPLAMAAGLSHRPGVMLLDEPTVGQDPATWAAVVGWMAAARDAGAVVALSTHDADLQPDARGPFRAGVTR